MLIMLRGMAGRYRTMVRAGALVLSTLLLVAQSLSLHFCGHVPEHTSPIKGGDHEHQAEFHAGSLFSPESTPPADHADGGWADVDLDNLAIAKPFDTTKIVWASYAAVLLLWLAPMFFLLGRNTSFPRLALLHSPPALYSLRPPLRAPPR